MLGAGVTDDPAVVETSPVWRSNRTKMFHVKRFGTIGAKNLKKPHPSSGLAACANARQTCLIEANGT
jgi:hypothetical protein